MRLFRVFVPIYCSPLYHLNLNQPLCISVHSQLYIQRYGRNLIQLPKLIPASQMSTSPEQYQLGSQQQSQQGDNSYIQANSQNTRNSLITNNAPGSFTEKQKNYLYDYYKHFCEEYFLHPKGRTFEGLKEFFETMSLAQWMKFCSRAHLVIKNTDSSAYQPGRTVHRQQPKVKQLVPINQLKSIFKLNEQKCHKLTFEGYCSAVKAVMAAIQQNNDKGGHLTPSQDPTHALGLASEANHIEAMDRMGIKFRRERLYLNDASAKSKNSKQIMKSGEFVLNQSRLVHHTNDVRVSSRPPNKQPSFNERLSKSSIYKKISNTNSQSKVGTSVEKKPIKYYRTREQRKQSELLTKLNLNNLNQFHPTPQILQNISKTGILAKQDDYFLKQYQKQQSKGTNKVIDKMDRKVKQYLKKLR